MSCGKALLETPKDAVEQLRPDLLKKLSRLSPSPVEDNVIEVGTFSDTWAPEGLRGRRLYVALFHSISKPVGPDDPFTFEGSSALTKEAAKTACGPRSPSVNWSGCVDPSYEYGNGCIPPDQLNYSECFSDTYYAPYLFTLNATPDNRSPLSSITAFAKPCPVASSAPDISGKPRMSDTVKIRCYNGTDTNNKINYNRYVAVDSSTNAYQFSGMSLGVSAKGDDPTTRHWVYAMSSSTASKSSIDVYYFFFTVGFYYAV
jgi:hypothetical protein